MIAPRHPFKIAFVFGTRPEAIKMAPVITHMGTLDAFDITTILTGQHREMLDQVVRVFDIPVTRDLNVMRENQSLPELTANLCAAVGAALTDIRPDCVIVQGDTTSCFVGALAAHYEKIPVAHLEAGLRTGDKWRPFPEEMNRRMVAALADFHFAPTDGARQNLLAEGVPESIVWVTGNSGVDALRLINERQGIVAQPDLDAAIRKCQGPVIAVTTHRRENVPFMSGIAAAIHELLEADPRLSVIFPVHLSPKVRNAVVPILADADRCHLIDPLPYDQFVLLLRRCDIILTDSGGVQEEAPYLGKPILVMRRATERPEAVNAGTVKLVGEDQNAIFDNTLTLLNDPDRRAEMSKAANPYGDGHTSERVADILIERLKHRT
jgi:UDP-N-acetylglucosamine 2-epimerase (non-hydrolysing)